MSSSNHKAYRERQLRLDSDSYDISADFIEDLHKRYKADIIRTGPRELSIASADAIPLIHGPMSRCRKTIWYGSSYHVEGASLQTTRNHQEHKERRKAWDRAFSAKALRGYEPRLNRHARVLIEKLKEHARSPAVRISSWISFFAFDVMGDIGYNRAFGMLENGKEDEIIALLHKGMAPMSILTHVPWMMSLALRTSFAARDMLKLVAFVQDVLVERKKVINETSQWQSEILTYTDYSLRTGCFFSSY